MSFFQALFYHLIDPIIIASGLVAGAFLDNFKPRLIVAFTIGLIVELIFVMQHPGQDVKLFTLLIGCLGAYLWMMVGARLKAAFFKLKT
jgi:hypothetical protein